MRVLVSQIGAREHYAVPRVLMANGALAELHTDYWIDNEHIINAINSRESADILRRAAGRWCKEIPSKLVRSYPIEATYWNMRLRNASDSLQKSALHAKWGRRFASKVSKDIRRSQPSAFFGFSGAALETMNAAKKLGILTVLDVIAPTHHENDLVQREQKLYPGHSEEYNLDSEFLARIDAEHNIADRILVNSEWTKRALCCRCIPEWKIHVVPLCYEAPSNAIQKSFHKNRSLNVLWLGTLNIRKGVLYALKAAELLIRYPVEFTFAGPSNLNFRILKMPSNCRYIGHIPRIGASKLLKHHDIFIFPTLSDGFGITQIEAIAHGLPVISTRCCGEVVEHGRSGFIVPPRSPSAIADSIVKIIDGECDLSELSANAIERSKYFSYDKLWERLRPVLSRDD